MCNGGTTYTQGNSQILKEVRIPLFVKKKKEEVVHILFKKCTHEINLLHNCRVTVCNPNPEELGYKPNEPNTINL